MIRLSFNLLVLSCALGVIACGSDDNRGDGSGGASNESGGSGNAGNGGGNTTCGASRCEPGQHCNNGICVAGCLTDANCGNAQQCADIDGDTKIGTCKSAPTKDCDALCEKAVACSDPDADQCMTLCEAASAACVSCLVDSNCGEGCDAVCQ
jgi:hypothetical protein